MHITILFVVLSSSLIQQYQARCTEESVEFSRCLRAYQKACVEAHNMYRRKHHAPALKPDSRLNKIAQEYAQYMADNNEFEHSDNEELGENLAYSWSSKVNSMDEDDCSYYADKYVKMWYDEVHEYDFNSPGFGHSTGHFTQLVWRATRTVGCGLAIASNNKIFAVSNYSPPGNYKSEYKENVLPR